jgi:amino acid adenylation domain-containing protein
MTEGRARSGTAAETSVLSILDWPEAGGFDLTLHGFLEHRARTDPARIAVASDTTRVSCAELNVGANQLAHALLSRGGEIGDRVCILMDHDAPLLMTALAVLKAGRVVVVLDPAEPAARLRQIAAGAGARTIVTDAANASAARELDDGMRMIVRADEIGRGQPVLNPDLAVPPDGLAFLVYTSGSTGEPKGVMRSHRQMLHGATRTARSYALEAGDRVGLVFAMSSEAGIPLAWAGLLSGASVHPFAMRRTSLPDFAVWIERHAVTVLSVTPTVLRNLDRRANFRTVRIMRLSSERSTAEDVELFRKYFRDDAVLIHSFGSSEAGTIFHRRIDREENVPEGPLAIGHPAHGIDIFIVDETGADVPAGQVGELVVRSTSLTGGYWGGGASADERFCEWPPGSGRRAMRTGDLIRINEAGMVEFAGRKDSVVKLGGNRIELSEVELALSRIPGVRQVAVLLGSQEARTDMIAFVACHHGAPCTRRSLRRELSKLLPAGMVPSIFVLLDDLPVGPTGKVDRSWLRQLPLPERAEFEPPRTGTEARLAEFWAMALEIPDIARDDDFFALGGDSLQATVIAAHVFESLGVEVDMGVFMQHPTLAEFAAAVGEMRWAEPAYALPPLVRDPRDNNLPVSNNQKNAWRGAQTASGLAAAMATTVRRIAGPLDRELLRECLSLLFKRHEMLRTSFPAVDGKPVQFIHPAEIFELPVTDCSRHSDPEAEAERIVDRETEQATDLATPPLMRFSLIRLGQEQHWLVCRFHHILADPWSWNVLLRELDLLYRAGQGGEAANPLPEIRLRYGDFAAWQHRLLERGTQPFQSLIGWWQTALAGAPTKSSLPRRSRAMPDADPRDGRILWRHDPAVAQQLDRLAQQERATFFIVRLAALVPVFAAATGSGDVVLGTYLTYRDRLALQTIFGPFNYLLPIRFRSEPALPFRQWIAAVNRAMIEFERHGAIPSETIYEEIGRRGAPLPVMQLIINVVPNAPHHRLGDLELTTGRGRPPGMQSGFHLQFFQGPDSRCFVQFDARIFDPARIGAMIDSYRAFLETAVREPDRTVGELLAKCGLPERRSVWSRLRRRA